MFGTGVLETVQYVLLDRVIVYIHLTKHTMILSSTCLLHYIKVAKSDSDVSVKCRINKVEGTHNPQPQFLSTQGTTNKNIR